MPTEQQQLIFSGGVNASAPAHAIGENEVQSAVNVDFDYEPGAAALRRGYANVGSVAAIQPIIKIYRHYLSNLGTSKLFICSYGSPSAVYVGTPGSGTFGFGAAISGGTNDIASFASFRENVLIGFSTNNLKHDGTTLTEWIKQAPSTAPTWSAATITPLALSTVYTCVEGTAVGTSGTGTFVADATTLRCQINGTLLTTNLNINGTDTIGDYGISSVNLAFSNPNKVKRITLDYSIGGTEFTSYWHTEMFQVGSFAAIPSFESVVQAENLEYSVREDFRSDRTERVKKVSSQISPAEDTLTPWRVPKTEFEFMGSTATSPGWADIQAVRIVVEASEAITIRLSNWTMDGAETYPLNDPDVGYVWWETWGKVDSAGTIISESAPSPISTPAKIQASRVTLTATSSTPTGTLHDLTHRCFYRQGGYLDDAYLIGTTTLAATTFVDSKSDIDALSTGIIMRRNIYPRSAAPSDIVAIAEPFNDRVFFAVGNKLHWSVPGMPDVVPYDNYTYVSHSGDEVAGLYSTPQGLVIINRDSIYELHGSVFDGLEQDWVLTRMLSRGGAKSRQAHCMTPVGIAYLDYEGINIYAPGQGVSTPLTWAMEKLQDAFAGVDTLDPATRKGSRIPAINKSYLINSALAWVDNKLYLSVPTGSGNAIPKTMFVMDFNTKTVWWYSYPNLGGSYSMYWDMESNKLYAGEGAGVVRQLESGYLDEPSSPQDKIWNIKTRAWTTPNDVVLENLKVEYVGEPAVVGAYVDGGSKIVLGTITSTVKDYFPLQLNGTIGSNIVFDLSGTATGTDMTAVYGIYWDALIQPARVHYYRTEHDLHEYAGEKLWDVQYSDLEFVGAGTLTAVSFIDGVAVMTNTIVSTNASIKSRDIYPFAFPEETYGDVAYTTYTASVNLFKHWNTKFDARNEPPRVNGWTSDRVSLEENICDALDADLNPNGTVTSIVYVDNAAIGTYSSTGTKRQSYTHALPNEVYGRTIYTRHTGSAFKHYNTWYHLRKEPDRWTNFVTTKQSQGETYWKNFNCTIDCLGGTVTATVMADGAAVGTYTFTGAANMRQSFVRALPVDTYSRTIWAIYAGGPRFKHYDTWFDGTEEPPKVSIAQAGPFVYASEQYMKTWVAILNPAGACVGVLYGNEINGGSRVALATATFSGTNKQTFNISLESSGAGATTNYADFFVVYTGTNLKHYETNLEVEPHPFKKKAWSIIYKKVGGAARLDQARFWTLDCEGSAGDVLVSTWYADGIAVATNTLTLASNGRNYLDMMPVPPGIRGYEYSQYISCASDITIWRSTLDTIRTGVKGYSQFSLRGAPSNG